MHTHEQPQAVIRNFLLRMEQFIRTRELIRPGASLVLGVSGGIDSSAMLDAFGMLQKKWNLRLCIAHVNYGLRGAASDGDERFVRRAGKRYGIPVYVKYAETKQISRARKVSIQLAAREIRYAFFLEVARETGADAIAVAHNAGDNAETMLFNFFRGSGIDGLKGISPTSGLAEGAALIRPLMFAGRSEIASYMNARRLRHREDASNATSAYSRNFLRRTVIPAVERRINPSLERTLNTEAAVFHSCSDFIGTVVDRSARECISLAPHGCSVSVKHLAHLHVFIQHMLIKRCFLLLGIEPNFVHIEEIVRLVSGGTGKIVDCGGGMFARRTHTTIEIGMRSADTPFLLSVDGEGKAGTDGFTFRLRSCPPPKRFGKDQCVEYVDAGALALPLTIRPWQKGDWFMPIGMRSKKKLSDFFADLKVPREQKARIPVVLSGNTIVWVAGLRLDDRFKVTPHTQSVYQLSIQYHT